MLRKPTAVFDEHWIRTTELKPGRLGVIEQKLHCYKPDKFDTDEYLFIEPPKLHTFCAWITLESYDFFDTNRLYLF